MHRSGRGEHPFMGLVAFGRNLGCAYFLINASLNLITPRTLVKSYNITIVPSFGAVLYVVLL